MNEATKDKGWPKQIASIEGNVAVYSTREATEAWENGGLMREVVRRYNAHDKLQERVEEMEKREVQARACVDDLEEMMDRFTVGDGFDGAPIEDLRKLYPRDTSSCEASRRWLARAAGAAPATVSISYGLPDKPESTIHSIPVVIDASIPEGGPHHRDHPRHFVVEFVDEGQRNRRQRRRQKKAGTR